MKTLILKNISKNYFTGNNETIAVNGIDLEIEKGTFVAIMGPSGSGKSTLLNVISTLDYPTSGNIFIDDEDYAKLTEKELAKFRRDKLGFIFQNYNLIETLTIKENIILPLVLRKENRNSINEKVDKVTKRFEIEDILEKFPNEVSGGQKQRAACARAIVVEPSLILADEPSGALDSKNSNILMNLFVAMNKEFNSTILMVTHDPYIASFSERIIFIKDGKIQNEINQQGSTKKEYYNEIIKVLSNFGGSYNVF